MTGQGPDNHRTTTGQGRTSPDGEYGGPGPARCLLGILSVIAAEYLTLLWDFDTLIVRFLANITICVSNYEYLFSERKRFG